MTQTHKFTNSLIHETSPYLLQHAHNPVNWYAWGNEALEKAKTENKLVLISVGYSACHWCHVMEHESFEDEATANLMNDFYVCIKVDREERPDIDQVYMQAVQLMTGHGGWPLNCIAMPDGRPIYGGTYFRNTDWKNILLQIAHLNKQDPAKCNQYADELTHGIKQSERILANPEKPDFLLSDVKAIYEPWKKDFDPIEGGPNRAPKFPMPNNYLFLLRYYYATKDKSALKHTELTLDKMAYGGIYDQLGGGFSRYATDVLWKVPHFEKMLYDNAQLISLYSEAYQLLKTPLYKQIVYETLAFVERELTSPEGSFYAALDADSEGEEGKYYVWTKDKIVSLLEEQSGLFCEYYTINTIGLWEHGNYILLRKKTDDVIAQNHGITVDELQKKIGQAKKILLKERETRVRPGLDDKQLTSWNALMLKGYVDAYTVFNESKFLQAALKNGEFILDKLKNGNGGLNHNYKNGQSTINGYLEDYSFTIEAFISLYEATFNEKWLEEAKSLMTYTILHFYDPESGMFFFTSDMDPALITRKIEIYDNVIPSSNSSIAKGLFLLSLYYAIEEYETMSMQMLNTVKKDMPRYGSGYSNWGILLLQQATPFYEIAISGKNAEQKRKELNNHYIPNKLIAGSAQKSDLPILENRYKGNETIVYLCEGTTCKEPVKSIEDLIEQINE